MILRPLLLAAAVLVALACGDDGSSAGGDGGSPEGVTACPEGGELECDSATEVCVIETPRGPGPVASCEPVPARCEADRSCGCLEAEVCQDPFDSCADSGENTVTCSCLACR